VLKPGGRFLCLEFSRPATGALAKAYDAYSFKVIPQVGEWSPRTAPPTSTWSRASAASPTSGFAGMMEEAGFSCGRYTNFTGGVAALHPAGRSEVHGQLSCPRSGG
jgi:demethylmenaquinone methyltransferase/2-methoxy-6-polyprenyl-1,4-benzoquinol methylase